MRSLSVRPQPTTHPATTTSSAEWCAVYEIASSHELPEVNVTRSVRSVWLRGKHERTYVRFMNRWKHALIGGYAVGLVACAPVVLAPAPVGRWIAVVATVLISAMSSVYSLSLRYDVVCLVVATYEFWFFSVSNLVSAVLLGVHLGDARAAMAFAIWFMLQNNIFTDANTVFNRGYLIAATGVLIFLLLLIATTTVGLIDNVVEFELLRLDSARRLIVQDALVHGYSTQAIMLARNIYRRMITPVRPKKTPTGTAIMHCVTLRARLKLRQVDREAPLTFSILPREPSTLQDADQSIRVRLKLVPVTVHFPVHRTSVSAVRRVLFTASISTRRCVRALLLSFAYVGLCSALVTALFPSLPDALRVVSFACSSVFIACLSMATQYQLLRRLVATFDFAFLSFQLLVVHVCLCDMLGWGGYSLTVITVWLWIQWVLTSDALTPAVKAAWGIQRRLPAIIMLVFIASQILVFVAIVLNDTIKLRNRVLMSVTIHGHLIEMKVIPTLLSRLVILFGWSWKVLWRMWTMQPDELLMIQGSLTYANPRRPRTQRTRTSPSVGIPPT